MKKNLLILTSIILALPLRADPPIPTQHNEATIAQLQSDMAAGKLKSEDLTKEYIARIQALDQSNPGVNALIELNPDALAMAKNADHLAFHSRSARYPFGRKLFLEGNGSGQPLVSGPGPDS